MNYDGDLFTAADELNAPRLQYCWFDFGFEVFRGGDTWLGTVSLWDGMGNYVCRFSPRDGAGITDDEREHIDHEVALMYEEFRHGRPPSKLRNDFVFSVPAPW